MNSHRNLYIQAISTLDPFETKENVFKKLDAVNDRGWILTKGGIYHSDDIVFSGTPLDYAFERSKTHAAEWLARRGAPFSGGQATYNKYLVEAIRSNDLGRIRILFLLEESAKKNHKSSPLDTFLDNKDCLMKIFVTKVATLEELLKNPQVKEKVAHLVRDTSPVGDKNQPFLCTLITSPKFLLGDSIRDEKDPEIKEMFTLLCANSVLREMEGFQRLYNTVSEVYGHQQAIHVLTQYTGNINDRYDDVRLYMKNIAMRKNGYDLTVAECLIKNKAAVEPADLYEAYSHANLEFFKFLLKAGGAKLLIVLKNGELNFPKLPLEQTETIDHFIRAFREQNESSSSLAPQDEADLKELRKTVSDYETQETQRVEAQRLKEERTRIEQKERDDASAKYGKEKHLREQQLDQQKQAQLREVIELKKHHIHPVPIAIATMGKDPDLSKEEVEKILNEAYKSPGNRVATDALNANGETSLMVAVDNQNSHAVLWLFDLKYVGYLRTTSIDIAVKHLDSKKLTASDHAASYEDDGTDQYKDSSQRRILDIFIEKALFPVSIMNVLEHKNYYALGKMNLYILLQKQDAIRCIEYVIAQGDDRALGILFRLGKEAVLGQLSARAKEASTLTPEEQLAERWRDFFKVISDKIYAHLLGGNIDFATADKLFAVLKKQNLSNPYSEEDRKNIARDFDMIRGRMEKHPRETSTLAEAPALPLPIDLDEKKQEEPRVNEGELDPSVLLRNQNRPGSPAQHGIFRINAPEEEHKVEGESPLYHALLMLGNAISTVENPSTRAKLQKALEAMQLIAMNKNNENNEPGTDSNNASVHSAQSQP